MRLRKYIAFAGMAVLMLCSCNEMENAPTNKFTDNSYWTSTTKAQYVVNMAYSQMYNAGRMWSDESLSDNAYDGRSVDDQRAIRKGMATPSLDIFKNEWKDLYGGIKTCHVFLEKVDLVPNMDASVKARMIAEIRYIRASLYFRLTNLYGAVPGIPACRRNFPGLPGYDRGRPAGRPPCGRRCDVPCAGRNAAAGRYGAGAGRRHHDGQL